MTDLFISYRRSDTIELAHCFRYAFRAAGHAPFVDTGSIPAGAAFASQIDEAIARAHLVLVLIGAGFDYEGLGSPRSVIAFEWMRARFHGCAVLPVLYDVKDIETRLLPAGLRWLASLNAKFVFKETFSADVDDIVASLPSVAHPPRPSARVLWIDDNPKNNVRERRVLRERGLSFDNVVSTDEAAEQLRNSPYDLVITDLGRRTPDERSHSAGLASLGMVMAAGGPPVIVYADRRAVELRQDVLALGGFGSTNAPGELYALVDRALGRTLPAPGAVLER